MKPKEHIQTILLLYKQEWKLEFHKEHKIFSNRKFRFDWYVPSMKLGIEYEGTMSEVSRHLTKKGYTTDCTKYNYAQMTGHKVLRYTIFNFRNFETDLKYLYENS